MTNRELLELAAKAAGMNVEWESQYGVAELFDNDAHREWNPLTDDGDALRLAVKLEIELSSAYDAGMNAYAGYSIDDDMKYIIEPTGADPYAATRRAIVRAAAEIGKKIP